MSDFIGQNERAVLAPYTKAVAVTKSDSTIIPATRALYIGGAGAVVVTMMDGSEATFSAVPVGTTLKIRVTQVKNATAATNILALY